MNSERITWIHSLKGLACLLVFFHHFFLTFYKATYTGDLADSKTISGIDATFGYRPYGIVLNGNFAVCLFLIISAFLFSGKVMQQKKQHAETDFFLICAKRYLQLMLHVAFIGFSLYLMKNILAFVVPDLSTFPFDLTLKELLLEVLFFQWITPSGKILGVLWTMKFFLLGAFLAAFLGTWSSKKRWYMPFIYLAVSYPLEFLSEYNFTVVLGVILADLYYYERIEQYMAFLKEKNIDISFVKNKRFRNILGILLLLAGLLVGSYPSFCEPTNLMYGLLMRIFSKIFPLTYMSSIHGFGVFLVMTGLFVMTSHAILSSYLCDKLGESSMGIYLLHNIVIALLDIRIFSMIFAKIENYHLAVFVIFALITVLTVVLARLYHHYIERGISYIIQKILAFTKPPHQN